MDAAELRLPGFEGLGKEVAVGDIEQELHAFFDSDQGIARASLMNLAIYSEDPASLEKNTAGIQELTRETACRAILVLSVPGGERSVRAWIEAHCNLTDSGEKAVCSEQVSFVLGGSSANLVRNIVFAHLDADLPVVVWWQGELSDIFEERLYSRIDRLIIDSREWQDPASQFLRITVARGSEGSEPHSFIPHDLSYTRTNPIRAAIASCFDDPRARRQVRDLSEAEIVHAPGHRISGLWLAAWLADRLDCQFDEISSQRNRYVFRKPGNGSGPFAVTLLEEASGDPDGRQAICRVRLGSADSRVAIWRTEEDRKFWKVVSEMPEMPLSEELIPARDPDDAGLVGEVLMRAGQNRVMCTVMAVLRELLAV